MATIWPGKSTVAEFTWKLATSVGETAKPLVSTPKIMLLGIRLTVAEVPIGTGLGNSEFVGMNAASLTARLNCEAEVGVKATTPSIQSLLAPENAMGNGS